MDTNEEYLSFFTDLLNRHFQGSTSTREAHADIAYWCRQHRYTPPRQGVSYWNHLSPLEEQNALFDLNLGLLCGERQHKVFQGSYAFPAYRLIRMGERDHPGNWQERWLQAYETVRGEGAVATEMVALTTSPIWKALSAFGYPWPPFDYGSGMDVEAVPFEEAEALGLMDHAAYAALDALRESTAPQLPSQPQDGLVFSDGNTIVRIP